MGGPGIDKFTIKEFQLHLEENLLLLHKMLLNGTYEPLPALKIVVKKDEFETRDISILTVRDRIVHTAVYNIAQPVFEPKFLDCNFGYRTNKGANQASNRVEKLIKLGNIHVLRSDIENFFDSIDTGLLYEMIAEEIKEEPLLNLIHMLLKAGEIEQGLGILQGATTSPLFSNIYLTGFDKEISEKYNFVRYADDFVILTKKKEESEEALNKVKESLQRLKLKINEKKTKITDINDGFLFVGYEFKDNIKRPSNKAIYEFVQKINNEARSPLRRERIRQIINGWKGYFQIDGLTLKEIRAKLEALVGTNNNKDPLILALVATLLELDDRETAKEKLSKCEFISDDPKVHLDAGILAFELELLEIAHEELLKAFKLGSVDPEVTYYLGLIYLNAGKTENALKFFQKTIDNNPGFSKAYYALSIAYKKLKLKKLSESMLLEGLNFDKSSLLSKEYKILLEKEESPAIREWSKAQLEKFANLFSGREGVHASQWIDNTGRTGYFPVRGKITAELIKEHLQGNITLGVYVSRVDNTVNFLVFDIDLKKDPTSKQENSTESKCEGTLEVANRIKEQCKSLEISAYIERTGGKGHHCWVFFSEPLKASLVRDFGKHILKNIGELPKNIDIEIFPKQDNVSQNGLGSLIKLPLGVDKKTGKRSFFVQEESSLGSDQSSFVENIKSFSKEEILKSLRKSQCPLTTPKVGENCNKLLEKCNVLSFLFNKAKENHELRHTERLVILYTFGHLGDEGKVFIHYIMSLCTNYNYNYTQRWINRLDKNKNPISCAKIRDWLSDITVALGCFCKFDLKKGEYPTPVNHLRSNFLLANEEITKVEEVKMEDDFSKKTAPKTTYTKMVDSSEARVEDDFNRKITALLDEYLRLKKEEGEIKRKVKDYKETIRKLLEETHQDTIKTDFGTLKIDSENKKFILELDSELDL